jgi:hypothetical protein
VLPFADLAAIRPWCAKESRIRPARSAEHHFVPSMPAFRHKEPARRPPPEAHQEKNGLARTTPGASGLEVDGQASGPCPVRVFGYLAGVHETLKQSHRHLHAGRQAIVGFRLGRVVGMPGPLDFDDDTRVLM